MRLKLEVAMKYRQRAFTVLFSHFLQTGVFHYERNNERVKRFQRASNKFKIHFLMSANTMLKMILRYVTLSIKKKRIAVPLTKYNPIIEEMRIREGQLRPLISLATQW